LRKEAKLNINGFYKQTLSALGDSTGAKNWNDWAKKFVAALGAGTSGSTATAAEVNKAADVSSYTLELTATAAIPATVRNVELNHATVVIAATYTVVPNTLMIIKDTSATGTAAHTVTLTGCTFNGTATVATLNARDEMLVVQFDSAGRGQVVANVGAVALS
jgi:hypothetical protein